MEIMIGGRETLVSIVKLCKMNISPRIALDMSRSPHPTIGYLLKDKHGHLESRSYG